MELFKVFTMISILWRNLQEATCDMYENPNSKYNMVNHPKPLEFGRFSNFKTMQKPMAESRTQLTSKRYSLHMFKQKDFRPERKANPTDRYHLNHLTMKHGQVLPQEVIRRQDSDGSFETKEIAIESVEKNKIYRASETSTLDPLDNKNGDSSKNLETTTKTSSLKTASSKLLNNTKKPTVRKSFTTKSTKPKKVQTTTIKKEEAKSLRSNPCKPGQRCNPKAAPLSLMEKTDESTKQPSTEDPKSTTDNGAGSQEYLSPYNIKAYLDTIVAHYPEANISVEVVGRTVSYNDIVLLKASYRNTSHAFFRTDDSKFADDGPEKPIFFIVHGLSPVGMKKVPCLYRTTQFRILLEYYFSHLDKFDIYLIPMANPDGLAVSGIWNKNVSPQSACSGVALDRNFDVEWNSNETIDPCSQQYPGPKPFSEEETRVVKDILHRNSQKIVAYAHVHASTYSPTSYKGDTVLYPPGFSDSRSDDDKYIDLKGEIDEAMKNASFQILTVSTDTVYSWYGKVHGCSVDYATSIFGIPYALEFCMQAYENDPTNTDPTLAETYVALTEVWRRVINATFNNIAKYGSSARRQGKKNIVY